MDHLASTAAASDIHSLPPTPTNCFGGTLDIEELLSLFTENGLQIAQAHGEAALQACANLEYSKCTQEEFLNVMKEYCSVHRQAASSAGSLAAAAGATAVVPVVGAAFGLMLALVKVSNAIKDRARAAREKVQAEELRRRYLRGLATCEDLSIEATRIAVVMSEIVGREVQDFESVQLGASSAATVTLLREELLPYLKSLSGRDPSEVKVAELRGKRWELKQRLVRQYEIVGVHLRRVEQGLCEMAAGNGLYSLKTNRLLAFARECLLEIHLRAWYAMMGYFDPENTMIEHDDRNVGVAASEKIAKIEELFVQYAETRFGMLKYRYQSKKDVRGIAKHEHSVMLVDEGADGDVLVPRLSIRSLMANAYVNCSEPEGGGIEHYPDGSCEIWNDTVWSGEDRCSSTGRYIHETVKAYVKDQLQIDGPVWTSSIGFVDRMKRAVQPALPQRPMLKTSMTMPARPLFSPLAPGSISTPSRIPMVQGWDHETVPARPSTHFQRGYCYSLSDSDVSGHHHQHHDAYS